MQVGGCMSVCICVWMCVVLAIASWVCGDKAFCSELRGQLLDTVQPHTYSNSLIHKSHRLTLGSPRCPDRWEQKQREESRQEEEEDSESRGGEEERERSAASCSPGPLTHGAAVLYSLSLSPTLFIVKPRPFNYTGPIPLKRDFDLLSVKASVQLMRFFLLWVSDWLGELIRTYTRSSIAVLEGLCVLMQPNTHTRTHTLLWSP